MFNLKTQHFKTGEELSPAEILSLLDCAILLKEERKHNHARDILKGKNIALIFDKPSLRTRFSFTVAVSELGGTTVESVSATRKSEEPEDLARVLSGFCHGIMIRTHDDNFIERMTKVSKVPIINGLSQFHHPCQILADLLTLKEVFKNLKGLTISYIGDGNNVLNSLLLLAPSVGIHVRYVCPKEYQPNPVILESAVKKSSGGGRITKCATPVEAVYEGNAVYTDVWTSMGFEAEKSTREEAFAGFQVNEELMVKAAKDAVVMHCMPMMRGKEISNTLPERENSVIFQQSENRLHAQKALLVGLYSLKIQ